jgi:MFS family permease
MQICATKDEGALYRKIAWRIVSLLFACYVVSVIDRLNIGFAKLQFATDLGLSDMEYGAIAGAFFFGYVLCEVPSNWFLVRIGARRTLFRIMILWGLASTLMAFAQGPRSFTALRFLLGAAEGGFFPGVVFLLSSWFPDRRRGRIMGLFVAAIPVAGILGGPLSGFLLHHLDGLWGLRGWQWLFLVEGPPAIVLAFVCIMTLADSPREATWLNESERRKLAQDLEGETRGAKVEETGQLKAAFSDPQVYFLAVVYSTIPFFNGANLWIPTILREANGASLMQIGWLSSAIAVGTAIIIIATGRSSDYFMERRWHLVSLALLAVAAYAALPFVSNSLASSVVMLGIGSGCGYAALGIFWTLPPAILGPSRSAIGIAVISSIGQLGGAASPMVVAWIKTSTGSIHLAVGAAAATLLAGMVLLLVGTKATAASQASPLPSHG